MPLSDNQPTTKVQLPASLGRKASAASLSVTPAAYDAASWADPTVALDARGYGSVSIWCTSAPSAAWTVQSGPDGSAWVDQAAVINTGDEIDTGSGLSAVCRAILPGGCYVRLDGGTGGTFLISAQ